MENNLYIYYCGLGSPPPEHWYLKQDIEIQRLYYITGGNGGYYGSDGNLHLFQIGHLYLFPYNLRHQFVSDKADPIRHMYFDFLSAPPIIAAAPLEYQIDGNIDLENAMRLACQILISRPKEVFIESPLSKHLLQFLLTLLDEMAPVPFHMDTVICKSLERIQNHYDQPITVQQLAAQAGFEENYFIRRFRSVMKQTPYAYLRNYRLMQARNLLRSGVSMDETAQKVGYESASSLSRALRQSKIIEDG